MYLTSLEVLGPYEVCFKDEYFKVCFFFQMCYLPFTLHIQGCDWLVMKSRSVSPS